MSAHESIFCLKRSGIELILGTPLPQGGFTGPGPEALLGLQQFFLPRPEAEKDPRYKQLIPYQLFCCQGRYFVYQRGGGVGEGRLAGRLSIGIGGHINSTDSVGDQLTIEDYYAALHREREEELICPAAMSADFIGWLNDDSDPVGEVHLGALHLCQVENETDVAIRLHGEDLHPCGWWPVSQIIREAARFEKWSMLALFCGEPLIAPTASVDR